MNTENTDIEQKTEELKQETQLTQTQTQEETEGSKRHYTRKQDMETGNQAILSVLGTTAEMALNKKEILAKLSEAHRKLVEPNWNLRLSFLQENGDIDSVGNKTAKKYFKATEMN